MKPGLIKTEILLLILVFVAWCSEAFDSERSGTLAFIFDDNRVFVYLDFVRPDGTPRKALAFVDLGTPQLMISENLRRELQVEQTKPVVFRVGGVEVKVDASAIATDSGFGMTGPDGKGPYRLKRSWAAV